MNINLFEKKIKDKIILTIIILFIFGFILGIKPVNAQTEPVMRFSPLIVDYYLNGNQTEISIDLLADNVVDMQAYQFSLDYDPDFLTLVKITPSDWLLPGAVATDRRSPGYVKYAYLKIPLPGVNGNGKLVTLTFQVKKFGLTELTLFEQCTYAPFNHNPIPFVTQDGVINATYDPEIIKLVNLNGAVSMQGRTNLKGANIQLDGQVVGNNYSWTGTTASGNNYVFNNIAMDLYTVWTNMPAYLNIPKSMNKQIALVGAATTLNPLHLVAGNAVWSDNEIDIHDFSLVAGNFGKTNFDSRADLNGDGKVDTFDLALVAGNYGKTSEEEYASWQP